MTDQPALNVVVVAYGAAALLDRCLATLGTELPVLVIDNSSSEHVNRVAGLRGCRYIDPGGNLGFAAGVNRALAELGQEHGDVLLLNPDAEITAEAVRALQNDMREVGHDRVACASPALVRDDGAAERAEWPFPTPGRAWLDAIGLGSYWHGKVFMVGAVLLLRSEAIDEIGPFDERFFLYAEETDWQRRATMAGWSGLACTALSASHTGAATSTDRTRREAMFHASSERYIRKWYGTSGWWVWRAGATAGAAVRSITGPNRRLQRLRLVAYLRGPQRWERVVGRPA